MIHKINLINEFKKKIKIIKEHNNLYFNQDNPKISDAEYDNIKNELIDLEKKNKFLKELNLLNNLVGSPPSNKFNKI